MDLAGRIWMRGAAWVCDTELSTATDIAFSKVLIDVLDPHAAQCYPPPLSGGAAPLAEAHSRALRFRASLRRRAAD